MPPNAHKRLAAAVLAAYFDSMRKGLAVLVLIAAVLGLLAGGVARAAPCAAMPVGAMPGMAMTGMVMTGMVMMGGGHCDGMPAHAPVPAGCALCVAVGVAALPAAQRWVPAVRRRVGRAAWRPVLLGAENDPPAPEAPPPRA